MGVATPVRVPMIMVMVMIMVMPSMIVLFHRLILLLLLERLHPPERWQKHACP